MLGLGAISLVAVASVMLLLRVSARGDRLRPEMVLGYPSAFFPAQGLTHHGPLAALAATQARLLSMYRQMPPASKSAIWLHTFLCELREIMDTTYCAALVTEVYGQSPVFDWLVVELQRVEEEIASQIARRLLLSEGDAQREFLTGRLATLRMCARELASTGEPMGLAVPFSESQN